MEGDVTTSLNGKGAFRINCPLDQSADETVGGGVKLNQSSTVMTQ